MIVALLIPIWFLLGIAVGWAIAYDLGWQDGWIDKSEGHLNPTRHWWGGRIEDDDE